MKYLITILILIYSHSSMSDHHTTIEGEMTCIITNQNVIGQKDGKVKQYRGHTDDVIEIGDILNFEYSIWIFPQGKELLNFKLDGEKFNLYNRMNDVLSWNTPGIKLQKSETTVPTIVQTRLDKTFPNEYTFTLQKDLFSYKRTYYDGIDQQHFIFKRYYKSDWMGTINFTEYREQVNDILITTIFMDCRHTTEDVWEEIFSHYYDFSAPSNELNLNN